MSFLIHVYHPLLIHSAHYIDLFSVIQASALMRSTTASAKPSWQKSASIVSSSAMPTLATRRASVSRYSVERSARGTI